MHGKGRFIWPNGTVYYGNWMKEKRHGYGILESKVTQERCAGEFIDGKSME